MNSAQSNFMVWLWLKDQSKTMVYKNYHIKGDTCISVRQGGATLHTYTIQFIVAVNKKLTFRCMIVLRCKRFRFRTVPQYAYARVHRFYVRAIV